MNQSGAIALWLATAVIGRANRANSLARRLLAGHEKQMASLIPAQTGIR